MPLRFSAERLRDACASQNVTAQVLAQRGGFSISSAYNYRTDRARPGADQLAAIAEALGVPLESFYVRVPDDTDPTPAQGLVA